jgi:cytidine deaminase
METYKIELSVQKKRIDELSEVEKQWRNAAIDAAERAYAPYSGFQVGVVVVLADGRLVTGNNQENAAYPSGLCAERVALFYAGACYPDTPVVAIVLAAVKKGLIQEYISPCGACRQVLLETEQRFKQPIQVLLCGREVVCLIDSATSLLPLFFGGDSLNQDKPHINSILSFNGNTPYTTL